MQVLFQKKAKVKLIHHNSIYLVTINLIVLANFIFKKCLTTKYKKNQRDLWIKNKLRNQNEEELNKGLDKLKEELHQLRTAKVAGGTPSKLGRIGVLY